MQISEFAFKLLLLFFPGIVCAYVFDHLTNHRPRQAPFFLLQSFVFGTASYFAYWGYLKLAPSFALPASPVDMVFIRALTDSKARFSFREIACASLAAVLLACALSILDRHKIPNRLARHLRITNKFGEIDVWGYLLNTRAVRWVTVRDHKNNLMYDGWVQAFSDTSESAEIMLRDVSVYKNDSAEPLYQVGAVYLAPKREDISIEWREQEVDERIRWKENSNEQRETSSETPTATQTGCQ